MLGWFQAMMPKEQRFFDLRWVHFFSGHIDHVRNASDDFESGAATREQIVGNENTVAQFFFVRLGKITVAYGRASDADLTRLCAGIDHFKSDILHRGADETFDLVLCLAIVTNPAAF